MLKLPKIYLVSGDADPLHDEAKIFQKKLLNLGKEAALIIFEFLGHGFLSLDAKNGIT